MRRFVRKASNVVSPVTTVRIGNQEVLLGEWQHRGYFAQAFFDVKRLPAGVEPKHPDLRGGRMTRQRERLVARRQKNCYILAVGGEP